MYSFLKRPRWIAGILLTVAIVIAFVMLGNWQLDRHNEVTLENEIRSARIAEDPLDLLVMLAAAGPSVDSLAYRRATATGEFEPEAEILVRNEVDANGIAGFHVVTPFVTDGGTLLVNRGWVPLAADHPPVEEAPPPTGEVEIQVILRSSQDRPRFGRVEPEGTLTVVNRIDLARLAAQFDDLLPVWGQLVGPDDGIPRPVAVPTFDDNGPHLEYALQWYAFALIAVGGAVFLIRSAARKPGRLEG